jgi:hypothetical protein
LAKSGAVEYRFSSIHVIEAAPVRLEDLDASKRAAMAIHSLCGSKALVPWQTLPVIEAAAYLLDDGADPPRERKTFHAREDRGFWFPSFERALHETVEELTLGFADPVALVENDPEVVLNRAIRRKAAREAKAGRAKRAMAADMRQNWPMIVDRLRQLFPVSDKSESEWRRLLLGTGSPVSTSNALRRDLADLDTALTWLASENGPGTELPKWLRSSSDDFVDLYRSTRDAVESSREKAEPVFGRAKLQRLWKESPLGRGDLQQRGLVEAAKRQILHEEPELRRLQLTVNSANETLDREGIAILPSLVTLSASIAANMRKNASPFEPRRNLDKVASDPGDVLHAVYLPYVDVMRVDKFSETYLGPIAADYSTSIVKRRLDLIPAIEERLALARSSS